MKRRMSQTPRRHTTDVQFFPPPAGFPSEVRIRGQAWRVVYQSPLFHDGKELLGLCQGAQRLIRLDPTQPDHVVVETLLHEMTHAYIWHCGAKLSPSQVEDVCDMFGSAIPDVFENNPELVRLLQRR